MPANDVGTILDDAELPLEYKTRLKQGYEWHLRDKGVENAMAWRQWAKTAFSINVNFDDKILYDHGFVQWLNGDRTYNGIFNVMIRNVCDALIMMDLAESGGDSFESNMSDGLSTSQMAFVKDNFDFFWIGYHDNNSRIPIILIPPPGRSQEVFHSEAFRKKQAEKRKKMYNF
jgi:hypothetical protein